MASRVGLCARRQGQELHQQALLVGTLALHDELLRMLGKLDVLVPLHAAHVVRDYAIELTIGVAVDRAHSSELANALACHFNPLLYG